MGKGVGAPKLVVAKVRPGLALVRFFNHRPGLALYAKRFIGVRAGFRVGLYNPSSCLTAAGVDAVGVGGRLRKSRRRGGRLQAMRVSLMAAKLRRFASAAFFRNSLYKAQTRR